MTQEQRSPAHSTGPATIIPPQSRAEPLRWPETVHELVEYEIAAAAAAAYHRGVEDGVRLARESYQQAIDEALRRPEEHGGPDLDESARRIVRDLYERYLGVGR